MTTNPNLSIFQNIIKAFDKLFGTEDTAKSPDKLTDEEIDEILNVQDNMSQSADALILVSKIFAERRLIAERNEKLCKTLLYRILTRTGVKEHVSEDGVAKLQPAYQFESDIKKLPEDYKMAARSKIHAAIVKGEKVPGVKVLSGFPTIRIS